MKRTSEDLPEAWRRAFLRDAAGQKPALADPAPERRLARLLEAFIATGLVFLALPGTLLGVWNLIAISITRQAASVSAGWIQAHGHAQLFGWVGTFIIGISLYTVPKMRRGAPASIPLAWAMLAMWTAGIAARWISGVSAWHWRALAPLSGCLEFAVAVLWAWQCLRPLRRAREPWEWFFLTGVAGLIATVAFQLLLVLRPSADPALPAAGDRILLSLALWSFCLPAVCAFSARYLPVFLGLRPPAARPALVSVALAACAAALQLSHLASLAAICALGSAIAAASALQILRPARMPAKINGVDPRYPLFVRFAFVWLSVAALFGLGSSPGLTGASRHAFTVGFLATMIFAIGPRILPSFLNSRELWSGRLMYASLVLLTAGCTLRVSAEPLAYAGIAAKAWFVLPASAMLELIAVLCFAFNIAKTVCAPVPSWFGRAQVRGGMSLYWYLASYPASRKVLIASGIRTLATARRVPVSLTLTEAAEADGADPDYVVAKLGDFFDARLTRAAKKQLNPPQGLA